MKRKRKRLDIRVYTDQECTGEYTKIGALTIYGEISGAVMDSLYQPDTGHPMRPYGYEEVMNFVAGNYGLRPRDLERAFFKCRKVYEDAVRDLYFEAYGQCYFAIQKSEEAKKALEDELRIAKDAAGYFKAKIGDKLPRRVIRSGGSSRNGS